MNKQIIKSDLLGESYIKVNHKSGLTILLYPMPSYSGAYATFGTKYGSIDTKFKKSGDKDFTEVPAGIAHFLEHKLFENEDCDVFELYAKTGASGNAYTSFDKTSYLFSCTDNFEDSLSILLDFVQKPYFTEATVQKEQGIIGQEIRMYDDNGQWRVFFNLLGAMYKNHPVKIDIAGTTESIAEITADLLYQCYNTFYNLHNMTLSIAGNFDVDSVLAVCDKYLKDNEPIEIERSMHDEPYEVSEKYVEQTLSVALPLFAFGYKMTPKSEMEALKAILECRIATELIVGDGSKLYKELYESGLINETFETEIFNGHGYFATIISGESNEWEKVKEKIDREIERVKIEGFDADEFEIIKKSMYGEQIRGFASVSGVAEAMLATNFEGLSVYDETQVLSKITPEDIMNRLSDFDINNTSVSIINPAK